MITLAAALLLCAWNPGPPPPPGRGPEPGLHGPHEMRPASWLDSAASGRTRQPWSALVELEVPGGRRDTARACGGPDGFRLDFRDGRAHWVHGDTAVFLHAASRTAKLNTPPRGIPPRAPKFLRDAKPVAMGTDTCLGRQVVVYLQQGPRGGARRLWIDTTLPLLLRGEGPGPAARRLLSLDLSRGCAADAFTIPPGWDIKVHEPKRPHEEPDIPSLERSIGFRIPVPTWIPGGFEPAGQSWMDGRKRRVAHVRWSDGVRHVSLFATKSSRGFRDCKDGPCQGGGPDPAMVKRIGDVSVLIAAPLSEEDLRRMIESLR